MFEDQELPQFYNKGEISKIIRRGVEIVRDDVASWLGDVLQSKGLLDINLFDSVRVPLFIMRIESLHTILDAFRSVQSYEAVLKNGGERVGVSFAIDFIKFLMGLNRIPYDHNVLIQTWVEHESAGKWGNIEIGDLSQTKELPSTVELTIRDNFLSMGYMSKEEPGRHAAFWEGYFQYVLDEFCLQYQQWVTRRFPAFTFPMLEIIAVKHEGGDNFTITVDNEKLTRTRQEFARAMFLYYRHDYRGSVLNMRTAMEFAIPEKVGIIKRDNERILWAPLLKVYKEVLSDFPKKEVSKIYGRASAVTHVNGRPIKDIVLCNFYYEVRRLIKTIQEIQISEEQKQTILTRKGEFLQHGQTFESS